MTAPVSGNVVACQRWRERREAYRPAGERFVPGRHEVVALPRDGDARPFVERHHYSASYPAALLRVGLMRCGVGLAGVAVFSVPMNEASIPKHTGVGPRAGVELGRFVLLDEVEGNAETWFLARAFSILERERPWIRAVVSRADPMPRLREDGSSFTPGHVGTIYQAHNGRYVGQSRPGWLWIAPDGRVISPRALSKIRGDEQGAAYAYAQLLRAGAPKRELGEAGGAYVARAMACGLFRKVRHPGNHVYAWAVGHAKSVTHGRMAGALPYPKAGLVLA